MPAGERPGKFAVNVLANLRQLMDSVVDEALQPLVTMAQALPVAAIIHEYLFERPRGYCGDAHLLDFIRLPRAETRSFRAGGSAGS